MISKSKLLCTVFALVGAVGVASEAAANCPPVTLSARGQVHTQVFDVTTGHMMTFLYERTHVDPTGAYAILGVRNVCPPQGCPVDPGETQDCILTSPQAAPFFNWGVVHKGALVATTSVGMSIKDPSGTLVLSQNVLGQRGKVLKAVCPQPEPGTSAPVIHVEIEDSGSGNVLGIVSVRTYKKVHPGSAQMDFYTLIGVDPSSVFMPEPASACVTVSDNPSGWYDLYWALSQNTISEQISSDASGTIVLEQGY